MWSLYLLYITNVLFFVGFCILAWRRPGVALVVLPFAMLGMFVSIMVFGIVPHQIETLELGIAACSILLFPVTIILARFAPTASPLETPWYKTFAAVVITVFEYLLLLAALTAIFNALGPLLFVLVVVGIVRYKLTHRYSLALDILSAIGMSMRQSLPLPMALHAAAQGQKRRPRNIFNNIAALLTEGRPLSEAIALGYPNCPPELLASIAAAEKMNQLPNAIENLQADISEKVNDYKRVRPVHPWYPLIVLTVCFFVILGLSIFIVPTLSEVISDVSGGLAYLPSSTQVMLDFSKFITARRGLNALLITAAALVIVIYLTFGYFRRRNPGRPGVRDRMEDWIKWHLPILHWFERVYAQLQLAETLRVGLSAGYPVNTTLRNALGLDMNYFFQRQTRQWLERVEQGEAIAAAALHCGFDPMMVWAFDESVNKGNTVGILESLEEVYRSRYNHRLNLLNAIGCPLMVLGLGLSVGWVVYAMFMGAFSTLFVTLQYTTP